MCRLCLFLTVLSLCLSAAAVTQSLPVPVRAAAGCSPGLTLTLQPGLHYGNIDLKPAPNIPPGPVSMQAPLFPGAAPSATPMRQPDISYPDTPDLKTAIAEYLAPRGWNRVMTWYRRHFAACDYTLRENGTLSRYGRPISKGLWFYSNSNSQLSVDMAFERPHPHQTLILYLAEDIAVPARPASSYLPANTVRIDVTYVPWPGANQPTAPPPEHRVITAARTIHTLVAIVNSLPVHPAGVESCAAERGQGASLRFVSTSGTSIGVVDNPACWIVTVGRGPALSDRQGGLWDTLTKLITGQPPRAAFWSESSAFRRSERAVSSKRTYHGIPLPTPQPSAVAGLPAAWLVVGHTATAGGFGSYCYGGVCVDMASEQIVATRAHAFAIVPAASQMTIIVGTHRIKAFMATLHAWPRPGPGRAAIWTLPVLSRHFGRFAVFILGPLRSQADQVLDAFVQFQPKHPTGDPHIVGGDVSYIWRLKPVRR